MDSFAKQMEKALKELTDKVEAFKEEAEGELIEVSVKDGDNEEELIKEATLKRIDELKDKHFN